VQPETLHAAAADHLAARFAGSLRARGVRAGDRVALLAPSSTGLVAAALGALRAGVVPVVLDPATPAAEASAVLGDAEPALTVRDAPTLSALLDGPAAVTGPTPLARPMHYTSGTTGRRKGVWTGVLAEPPARALWAEEAEQWALGSADVHLVVSPLHHSAPLRFALGTLLARGAIVVPGRFGVEGFVAACERYRPSTLFTAPAQLQRLHEHDGAGVRRALRGFRLIAHAGARCPEPTKRWLVDVVGADPVWEFYGSTEGQFTVCPATEWLQRPGTVGRARAGRRLSVDDDGTIWCTVPPYARFSYWRDPAKTAAAWRDTPDGPAFTVGDHGRLDDAGYLYLDGRREDLVISGGVNVYPLEVERVLAECPGVTDVAVFGVDDDRWGQRVEAAVSGAVTPDAVLAFAHDRLAPAKRPKAVHVVEALPRTSTGKVRRLDLPGVLGR
jgi:long-chain acyl-CoA synthetase